MELVFQQVTHRELERSIMYKEKETWHNITSLHLLIRYSEQEFSHSTVTLPKQHDHTGHLVHIRQNDCVQFEEQSPGIIHSMALLPHHHYSGQAGIQHDYILITSMLQFLSQYRHTRGMQVQKPLITLNHMVWILEMLIVSLATQLNEQQDI